jgi:hypothetical protein
VIDAATFDRQVTWAANDLADAERSGADTDTLRNLRALYLRAARAVREVKAALNYAPRRRVTVSYISKEGEARA